MSTRITGVITNGKWVVAFLSSLFLVTSAFVYAQQTTRPAPDPSYNNMRLNTEISRDIFHSNAFNDVFSNSIKGSFGGWAYTGMQNMVGYHYLALDLRLTAVEKREGATVHAEQGRLYIRQGQPEKALGAIEQAEALTKADANPRLQASLLDLKGTAYMAGGQFEKGMDSYREAMVVLREIGDLNGQAEMFLRAGWGFQSLHDPKRAIGCYEAAQGFFEKSSNQEGILRAKMGIRSANQMIGEVALILPEENWVALGASSDDAARITAMDAQVLLARKQVTVALERYQKALDLLSTTNPVLAGQILAGMGRSEMALRFYDQAEKHLQLARSKMKLAGNRDGEAAILASLSDLKIALVLRSEVHNTRKPLMTALEGYSEALALMRETRDRSGQMNVLTGMGIAYEILGKYSDALNSYLEALKLLESIHNSTSLQEFQQDQWKQASTLYDLAIYTALQLKRHEDAFNLTERARATSFRRLLGSANISARRTLSPEFVERADDLQRQSLLLERQLGQELAKPDADIDGQKVLFLRTRMEQVSDEDQALIEKLHSSAPSSAPYLSVPALTLNEVQARLDADTTLISYFATPEKSWAFVVSKKGLRGGETHTSEPQVANAISILKNFGNSSEASAALRPLYDVLIKSIASDLKTRSLVIVPFDDLYEVPFSALSADGVHYLGDEYAIAYLPSASAVAYQRKDINGAKTQLLVLSDGKLDGQPPSEKLMGESQAIASLYGTEPRLSGDAALTFLRDEGSNADLIHIVSRTGMAALDPSSGVALDGQSSSPLQQVAALDLMKTSLVVLSGRLFNTPTPRSYLEMLSEAFMYAGAQSVIATKWDVDKDASKLFMVSFYTHLKARDSTAQALRAAQAETRVKYPHPYYWAGFALTGTSSN